MAKHKELNDLAIANELGIEAVSLRETTKDFDEVWSEFIQKLKTSVDAVRAGSTKAPMICGVIRRTNAKVRKPFFKVGAGEKNYWFPNGLHPKGKGFCLETQRHIIEQLDSPRVIEALKPYVRAKFEAEQVRGRKAHQKKLANTAIGYGTVEFVPTAANDTLRSDFVTVDVA